MGDSAGHSGTWWRRRRLWPVQSAPAVSAVALGSPFALALQGLPVGTGPGRRNGNSHHLTVPAARLRWWRAGRILRHGDGDARRSE